MQHRPAVLEVMPRRPKLLAQGVVPHHPQQPVLVKVHDRVRLIPGPPVPPTHAVGGGRHSSPGVRFEV